jgi:outer membrane immunogenic protein
MRTKIAIVAALACLLSAPALAQPLTTYSLANGSNYADASSWLAGGQLGYDWQDGALVYGLAADLYGINLKSEMNDGLAFPNLVSATASTSAKINLYGTVRGRFGWASGPLLLYATGGFAYGKVDLKSNFNVTFPPPPGTLGSLNSETSPVKTGWVAGGGFEYMFRPNLTLTLEYQYVDLGTVSLASSTTVTIPPISIGQMSQSANVHAQFQTVTAGLNWYFAPTDKGQPWAGWFVGGRAGGAWGNKASASYASSCLTCLAGSDVRLKRDIVLVGRLKDGLGIYRYRYLWSDTVYVGVLAQEVALDHPDAVVRGPFGYLMVDYGKLGLRMMTEAQWDIARVRLALLSGSAALGKLVGAATDQPDARER